MLVVNPYLTHLAAAVGGDFGPADFVQYGILGVVAGILLVYAKTSIQRERDRADRLEADKERLHGLILERVMPVLESATHAAEKSADVLGALLREREIAQAAEARRHIGGSGS